MIWLAGLPVIWWAAILIADAIQPGRNLFELMEVLTEKLNHPFQLHYTEYTIKSVLVCTLLYAAGIGNFLFQPEELPQRGRTWFRQMG